MDSFESESETGSFLNTAKSQDARSILSYIRGTVAARGASVADQIAAIQPEQLLVAEPRELPKIRVNNADFILEEWLHKKLPRSSWIFKYFRVLEKLESDVKGKEGTYLQCVLCDQKSKVKLFTGTSTTSPIYHLNKEHSLYAESDGDDSEDIRSLSSSTPSVLEQQRRAAQKRPLIVKDRAEAFRELLLGWIADANIPLSAVEHHLFRKLLVLLNPEFVNELLPSSANTIKS